MTKEDVEDASGEGQQECWFGGCLESSEMESGSWKRLLLEWGKSGHPCYGDKPGSKLETVRVWKLLSVYLQEQLSGIVMASVGVDRSVCVDCTAKVWGFLLRRTRWLPTFSYILFPLFFSLSRSFLLSPLFFNYNYDSKLIFPEESK